MGLMEVSGFGCDLFWMEREKFVSWIWDKEHNNQRSFPWLIYIGENSNIADPGSGGKGGRGEVTGPSQI